LNLFIGFGHGDTRSVFPGSLFGLLGWFFEWIWTLLWFFEWIWTLIGFLNWTLDLDGFSKDLVWFLRIWFGLGFGFSQDLVSVLSFGIG
jgi:hypothetical protein